LATWPTLWSLLGWLGNAEAFYHSAVNFTTLGHGYIFMSRRWRLLGPLEAVNGSLMLGLSAAMFLTVPGKVAETRLPRLAGDIG